MRKLFLILFALIGCATDAEATRYWASPSGGAGSCGAASGTSDPGLYRTLRQGIQCLAGGDELVLKAGTFTETLNDLTTNIPSGTAGTRTIIRAETALTAIVKPASSSGYAFLIFNNTPQQYITFDGLEVDCINCTSGGPFKIEAGSNIRVVNSHLHNAPNANVILIAGSFNEIVNNDIHHADPGCAQPCGGYGIYNTGQNNLFERNKIHDNTGYGLHSYSINGGVDNNRFFQNEIRNNCLGNAPCGEVTVSNGSNNEFYNNIIRPGSAGSENVLNVHNSSGTKVYSNTIYRPGLGAVIITENSSGLDIKNNIISAGAPSINLLGGASTTSNNLCNVSGALCNVVGNPLFTDAANGDFRLLTGSPAINAGAALGSPFNVDYAGTSRPQDAGWDIGAYEFGGAPPPPSCSSPVLVASYSADNTPNDGTGTNHGSPHASVTYVAGKYGQAWSLTGAGGITIPDANALDFTNGLSLGAWVKMNALGGDQVLIVKNPNSTYYLFASGQQWCAANANLGGYGQASPQVACSSTPLTVGVWAYLEISWSPPNLILRKDGTDVNQNTNATATLSATTGTLQIGSSMFNEHLNGLIDNVRIYNCGITLAQHISDMNTPLGTPATPVSIKLSGITEKFGTGVSQKLGFGQ